MTPRTFWTIILKILGIYIILQIITNVPGVINLVYEGFTVLKSESVPINLNSPIATSGIDNQAFILEVMYTIGLLMVYALIAYNCFFKTERLINKFKLADGFDDQHLELNIHRSTILKIVIMLTGGTMLVTYIPAFFMNVATYFQHDKGYRNFIENPESKYLILNLAKIFIGYFMLSCSRMIVNYIELKQRKRASIDNNPLEL